MVIWKKKCSRKICTKMSMGAHVYLPHGVEVRGSKSCHLWNIIMYKKGKVVSLQSTMLPKIHIISKNASNKSCWALNYVQKSQKSICLPPLGVQLVGSKNCHLRNIIMYKNGKVDSLQSTMLPKIRIISKNASNKSCSALNYVQKSQKGIYLPSPGMQLESSKNCHL